MLLAWLDFHRATLRQKASGLDGAQLSTRLEPSTLTLGGLVKHMALVEDWWLGVNLAGRAAMAPFDAVDWDATPDWEFDTAAEDSPDELFALHERAVAACDEILGDHHDLDAVAVRRHPRTGEGVSLRWILTHMVEEYARHNGHADLIRESIDTSTGSARRGSTGE